jgi:Protein of unknown function (DUF3014)
MDYDDLEIERPDEDLDTTPPAGGGPGPLLAAGGAVLLVVLALVVFLVLRHKRPVVEPTPPPQPATLAPQPPPTPSPTAEPSAEAVPSLDQSDSFVRGLLAALSADPHLSSWLSVDDLVRRFVAMVVNIAQGENPAPHLRFLAPDGRLRVVARGRHLAIDPASYNRFDAFAGVVSSIDAATAAQIYRRLGPLLDAAARELGQPAGEIDVLVSRAAASLLAAPVLQGDVLLVSDIPLYRFADKKLETLAPAQKQLIRMGPRNQRLIQEKLKELTTALALPTPR